MGVVVRVVGVLGVVGVRVVVVVVVVVVGIASGITCRLIWNYGREPALHQVAIYRSF